MADEQLIATRQDLRGVILEPPAGGFVTSSQRWEAPDRLTYELASLLHRSTEQISFLDRCLADTADEPEVDTLLRAMRQQEERWVESLRSLVEERLGSGHPMLTPEPW